MVKESTEYENYLDQQARMQDEYRMSLETITGVIDTPLADNSGKKKVDPDLWKSIYLHFRNVEDIADLSQKIGYIVDSTVKSFWYPLADKRGSLFPDEADQPALAALPAVAGLAARPKKKTSETRGSLDIDVVIADEDKEWKKHWVGMPEYEYIEDNGPYRSVTVKFRCVEDYEEFARRIDQELTEKTNAIWHPKLERTPNYLLRWVEAE